MRGSARWVVMVAVLLAAAGEVSSREQAADPRPFGLGGKVEVRQIEQAYRLDGDLLKVRVHLVSGLAVDYETRDATDTSRILEMTRIYATGRARMLVEIEGGMIRAFHIAVP